MASAVGHDAEAQRLAAYHDTSRKVGKTFGLGALVFFTLTLLATLAALAVTTERHPTGHAAAAKCVEVASRRPAWPARGQQRVVASGSSTNVVGAHA